MTFKNYHFAEIVTGEEFIVDAYTFSGAEITAKEIAAELANAYELEEPPQLMYYGTVTDTMAEMMGLDVY